MLMLMTQEHRPTTAAEDNDHDPEQHEQRAPARRGRAHRVETSSA